MTAPGRHSESVSSSGQGADLVEREVDYRDDRGDLHGFLATPAQTAPDAAGVVVVHGGAGLDEHARGRARILARLGYVAFAADMYGAGVLGDRERVMTAIQGLFADRRGLVTRLQAAIDVIAAYEGTQRRVAGIGYCLGGRVILEAARSGVALTAAISVHGGLSTDTQAAPGQIAAPILVCHGSADPHVPTEQLLAFMTEMDGAGADWQLLVLGGALHGFTHPTDPRFAGSAYDGDADARSQRAIAAFLAACT